MRLTSQYTLCPLAPAHLVGIAALQLALTLAFFDISWAVIPLSAFVVLCLVAPFAQQLRFFLPIMRRGDRNKPIVAITFDDGPDALTTPLLLDLLSKHSARAAFFVVGKQAETHPELIRDILKRGHEIGNHSYSHDPFLMLRQPSVVIGEIARGQAVLQHLGIKSLAFRPPVGITNPSLFRILLELGMHCVGFNRRGLDFGNRRVTGMAKRILSKVRAGDVILLHDKSPESGISVESWLREVEAVLTGIPARGLTIRPLSQVVRQPVMQWTGLEGGAEIRTESGPNLVRNFYDGLAEGYDMEQEQSVQGRVRRAECEVVLNRLPVMVKKSDRVLEIGAGTGRFTLVLARHAKQVLAVDLSRGMLDLLRLKMERAGLQNVETRQGDICRLDLDGFFDFICGFSCFEYIADLEALFRRLHGHMQPGGILYFTIAHCSLFRLFAQLGNAMRQGIWLHARSKTEITRMLQAAGLTPRALSTHGLKSALSSGVLMEVVAQKAAGDVSSERRRSQNHVG